MHPFRAFIHEYNILPEEDWFAVEACLIVKRYKKGERLLEAGQVCRKLSFLESGALRYHVEKDGQDVTKFFTIPPYCFTSQRSFANETPSTETIEALEESKVWEMSKADTYRLLELKSWSDFARKLTQEVQYFTEQILEDLQNKTAEERYIELIETQSILLQKVPLKHLATYLGIAPQSLSRIRKKYIEQKRT